METVKNIKVKKSKTKSNKIICYSFGMCDIGKKNKKC